MNLLFMNCSPIITFLITSRQGTSRLVHQVDDGEAKRNEKAEFKVWMTLCRVVHGGTGATNISFLSISSSFLTRPGPLQGLIRGFLVIWLSLLA